MLKKSRLLAALFFTLFAGLFVINGQGQSLLWKVAGGGLSQPSYLYGTMHSKSKKVFSFSETVLDKFEAADAFAAELSLDSASMIQAAQKMMVPENQSLHKLLRKKDYKLVDKTLQAELGFPLEAFDRYQPIFVMTTLQQTELVNGEMPAALDQYLYDKARKAGKKVYGVETIEEQSAALGSMPVKEQAKMLVKAVKSLEKDRDKAKKENERMLDYYLKGDLNGLLSLFNDGEQMPAKMKDELLDKRNLVMADRIEPLVRKHSAFIAIGAAHFPGNNGLIELLRKKGFTVTPVPFTFDGSGFARLTAGDQNENLNAESAAEWVSYKNETGNFNALFPTQPQENGQNGASAAVSMDMSTGKTFMVSYGPAESAQTAEQTEKRMNAEIEKAIKQFNGKIVASRNVKTANINGKETEIEVMGVMTVKMRVFMRQKNLYSLTAAGFKGEAFEQEANKFFNNFQFLHP